MRTILFILAFGGFLLLPSCDFNIGELADSIDDSNKILDQLRRDLVAESNDWQGESGVWRDLIENAQDQLSEDLQKTIQGLERIAIEAERMAGNITTCTTQYFLESLAYQVEMLMAELTGSLPDVSLLEQSPVSHQLILCHSFRNEISLSSGAESLRFSIIGYFGEIGSEIDLRIHLKSHDGSRTSRTGIITRSGNNEIRLDLSSLFYSGDLERSYSVLIVDGSTSKDLGEYVIYP